MAIMQESDSTLVRVFDMLQDQVQNQNDDVRALSSKVDCMLDAMKWDQRRKAGHINSALFGWPFQVVKKEADEGELASTWEECWVELQFNTPTRDCLLPASTFHVQYDSGHYDHLIDMELKTVFEKYDGKVRNPGQCKRWAITTKLLQKLAPSLELKSACVLNDAPEMCLKTTQGKTVDEWVHMILTVCDHLEIPRCKIEKLTLYNNQFYSGLLYKMRIGGASVAREHAFMVENVDDRWEHMEWMLQFPYVQDHGLSGAMQNAFGF
jgi:hypothetical protein